MVKYYQLVPTRAINALSDWLVFNLEEIGIEDPPVYSRLLLSLLHTTFHVNNFEQEADISNFKEIRKLVHAKLNIRQAKFENREIKVLSAVNALIKAAPNSPALKVEKSVVVDLVNELYSKIQEFDNESTSIATVDSNNTQNNNNNNNNSSSSTNIGNRFNTSAASLNAAKQYQIAPSSLEDITQKYYSAFPALSNQELAEGGKPKNATEKVHKKSSRSWPLNDECTCSSLKYPPGSEPLRRKYKRKRQGPVPSRKRHIKKQNLLEPDSLWDTNFETPWEQGDMEEMANADSRNNNGDENCTDFMRKWFETYEELQGVSLSHHQLPVSLQEFYLKFKCMNVKKLWEDTIDNEQVWNGPPRADPNKIEPLQIELVDSKKYPCVSRCLQEQQNDYYSAAQKSIWGDASMTIMPQQAVGTPQQSIFWNELTGWSERTNAMISPNMQESLAWEQLINNQQSIFNNNNRSSHINNRYPLVPISPNDLPEQAAKNYYENNKEIITKSSLITNEIWTDTGETSGGDWNVNKFKELCSYYEKSETPYSPKPSAYSGIRRSECSSYSKVNGTPQGTNIMTTQQVSVSQKNDPTPDELYMSDKTKFRPITALPNGFMFPTDSETDKIDYRRTEDGTLRTDSGEYLEFVGVSDGLEEDGPANRLVIVKPQGNEFGFTVKVKLETENDKACQTDPEYETLLDSNANVAKFPTSPQTLSYVVMRDCFFKDTKIGYCDEDSDEEIQGLTEERDDYIISDLPPKTPSIIPRFCDEESLLEELALEKLEIRKDLESEQEDETNNQLLQKVPDFVPESKIETAENLQLQILETFRPYLYKDIDFIEKVVPDLIPQVNKIMKTQDKQMDYVDTTINCGFKPQSDPGNDKNLDDQDLVNMIKMKHYTKEQSYVPGDNCLILREPDVSKYRPLTR